MGRSCDCSLSDCKDCPALTSTSTPTGLELLRAHLPQLDTAAEEAAERLTDSDAWPPGDLQMFITWKEPLYKKRGLFRRERLVEYIHVFSRYQSIAIDNDYTRLSLTDSGELFVHSVCEHPGLSGALHDGWCPLEWLTDGRATDAEFIFTVGPQVVDMRIQGFLAELDKLGR